jgi:hypothetical protein
MAVNPYNVSEAQAARRRREAVEERRRRLTAIGVTPNRPDDLPVDEDAERARRRQPALDGFWTTARGRTVAIRELSERHLLNIERSLRVTGPNPDINLEIQRRGLTPLPDVDPALQRCRTAATQFHAAWHELRQGDRIAASNTLEWLLRNIGLADVAEELRREFTTGGALQAVGEYANPTGPTEHILSDNIFGDDDTAEVFRHRAMVDNTAFFTTSPETLRLRNPPPPPPPSRRLANLFEPDQPSNDEDANGFVGQTRRLLLDEE